MNDDLSFEDLERLEGCTYGPTDRDDFPIPMWYASVRKTPLRDLSLEDLCQACRQDVFLEYMVPRAMDVIEKEPLAGAIREGELLSALAHLPGAYWSQHKSELRKIASIATEAIEFVAGDSVLRQDIEYLLQRAASLCA